MTLSQLTHRFELPATRPRKLAVVMHGRGDSMDGFAWLPSALDHPGLGYLFLNAPDDYFDGYSWYDLPPNQGPGILRSRALLFGVLDDLRSQGYKSEDVLLFGFSQGCLMAIDVGLRYPHPLGGVCGVSGYMFFPETLDAELVPHARQMPWLLTHGTFDDVLPIAATREHVELLRGAGVPVDWHEFRKPHTIEPRRELPLLREWFAARAEE